MSTVNRPVQPRPFDPAPVPRAAKGYVLNLALDPIGGSGDAGEHPFTFWYRPTTVTLRGAASYAGMRPLGMPFAYKVYEGGDNDTFQLALWVHRQQLAADAASVASKTAGGRGADLRLASERIRAGVRYLQALLVPPSLYPGLIGGAPPACMVVLPGVLSLRCRLTQCDVEYAEVDADGLPVLVNIEATFEEAPLGRYTMQDVLLRGAERTWGLV